MRRPNILLAALGIAIGCDGGPPARSHDELEGHAGAHDSSAVDQQFLAAARNKPPIITAADVRAALNLSDSVSAQAAPHVTMLNAALLEIVELHKQHGSTSSAAKKEELNRRTSMAHVHADRQEDALHNLLSAMQHEQFHKLLQQRAARFGLGIDEAHGDRLFGTAGALYGVDTARAKR